MKTVAKIVLLGSVLVGLISYAWTLFGNQGMTDQKAIYSTMQGIEIDYRNKDVSTPFFLEESGLRVIALPSQDEKFPYVWVALNQNNPSDADGVYRVGTTLPKKIDCVLLNGVLNDEKVLQNVRVFIKHQCSSVP